MSSIYSFYWSRIESERESEVTQSCPTLCDPMDCSPPGSWVHWIFQARILEWVAISFSRRSSQPSDWTRVSPIVGRCFTIWATREDSVQFSSVPQFCPTLWDPMNGSTPGLPVHHKLPEFTQTHVHRVGDAMQPSHLCCPLLLLPSIPPSIRVFSKESTLHMRWPKYWSFSFSISTSNEHQSNAQNSPSQASAICEPWTSWCSSWF